MRNLVILIIELLEHFFPREIEPRSALAEHLRSALNHLLNWLVRVLRLESLLQVARVVVDAIQAVTLILDFTNELWQVLVSQVIGLVHHLVVAEELGRVSIKVAHLLITRDLRGPLTRMRPGIENRLVRNSSLLGHLEQCLFGYIVLGGVLRGNVANLLIAIEFLSNFVLLDDCWWVDLRVFWFLLEEEAFRKVLLMTLEGSEVFN
jgi:hypothetical protein